MLFAIILKSSKAHHFDIKSNVLYGSRYHDNDQLIRTDKCVFNSDQVMPRYSDNINEWYVTIVSPSARVHFKVDFKKYFLYILWETHYFLNLNVQ